MNNEYDTFYLNPDTQERVRVTYRVILVMPASYDGYVYVEADSEEEAIRLALNDRFADVEWDYSDCGDKCGAEVLDVECEDPPVDAILIRRNCTSTASLDFLFESDDQLPLLTGHRQAPPADGAGQCN
jgi:hypothetical protein